MSETNHESTEAGSERDHARRTATSRTPRSVLEALDIVPAGYLEIPWVEDCRGVDKDDAAEVYDGLLRRVARQEALARRVIGRLASRLIARRAYNAFGFARLRDYSRERLGMAGRELQSLAYVAKRLEALPAIAAAFQRGELNWTKTRQLVSIAAAENEAAWLELARSRPASELQEIIKDHRAAAAANAATRPVGPAHVDRPDDLEKADDSRHLDGEPRRLFRIPCPSRIRWLWKRMVRMASKVAGADLAQWQAAETIAAEALSAAPLPAVGPAGEAGAAPRAAAQAHDEPRGLAWAAFMADPSNSGADGDRPRDKNGRANLPLPRLRGCDHDDELAAFASLRATCDRSATSDAPSEAIEELAHGADELDPHDLDARLGHAIAAMQRIDWQLGRLLATFSRLRLHHNLGFPTWSEYLTDRLGISVRKAGSLVRVERASWDCGVELTDAYRTGDLSWNQVLALLPVVSDRYLAEWIERARSITLRRLQDEVDWAMESRDQSAIKWPVAPPAAGMDLQLDEPLSARDVRGRGDRERRSDTEDGADRQFGAPSDDADAASSSTVSPNDEFLDAEVRFAGPESVVMLLRDAVLAYRRAGDPPWKAFERVLLHAGPHWQSSARKREPIHERDGWRCRVPGCSSQRNLEQHHLVYRSHGGPDDTSNLVSVCAWHHRRGIHNAAVRAWGNADEEVYWELGIDKTGEPLMRLRDDTYLS